MGKESRYYTVVTDYGNSEVLKAVMEERKINITEIAVGDGDGSYYIPDTSQTNLKNEVWRGAANVYISTKNSIEVKSILPGDVGGFTIREMGVYDDAGRLVAVCNTPDSPKVTVEDGVVQEMDLCMEIMFINSNVQDVINLAVDPNITVATKEDIQKIKEELENIGSPTFVESENRENINSGESYDTLFGKIKKWLADLGAAAFASIANNCTTTEEGHVLDARQGTALQEQVDEIKGSIDELKKSVADGKALIASAITRKGITTASDADFETIAANIARIVVSTDTVHSVYATCTYNGKAANQMVMTLYKDGQPLGSKNYTSSAYGTYYTNTYSV